MNNNTIDGRFLLEYLQAELAYKKANAVLNRTKEYRAKEEARKTRDKYRKVLKNPEMHLDSKAEKYLDLQHQKVEYEVSYYKPIITARVENTRSEIFGRIIKLLTQ